MDKRSLKKTKYHDISSESEEHETASESDESSYAWTSEPEDEGAGCKTDSEDIEDYENKHPTEIFVGENKYVGSSKGSKEDFGSRKWLKKGACRHVRQASRAVSQAMQEEAAKRRKASQENEQDKVTSEQAKPIKRKPGPWRLVEIFTWTCMISMLAADRGWDAFEPITLPQWDLRRAADRAQASEYLERVDPDLLVVQTPCTPWSVLQQTNQRTPVQVRNLRHKKAEARSYLGWVAETVEWQRQRGRVVLHENPRKSMLWKEPPIEAAFSKPGTGVAKVDMCMYGKARPDTGELVHKPLTFKGTREVCEGIGRVCNKTHQHSPIGGAIAADPKVGRHSMSMSEWSGGYTDALALGIVSHSEAFLEKHFKANAATLKVPSGKQRTSQRKTLPFLTKRCVMTLGQPVSCHQI